MAKILRLIIGIAVALAVFLGLSFLRGESRFTSSIAQGKKYVEAGDVNGAFLSYGDAIRIDPKRPDGYFLRAAAMLKLNKPICISGMSGKGAAGHWCCRNGAWRLVPAYQKGLSETPIAYLAYFSKVD